MDSVAFSVTNCCVTICKLADTVFHHQASVSLIRSLQRRAQFAEQDTSSHARSTVPSSGQNMQHMASRTKFKSLMILTVKNAMFIVITSLQICVNEPNSCHSSQIIPDSIYIGRAYIGNGIHGAACVITWAFVLPCSLAPRRHATLPYIPRACSGRPREQLVSWSVNLKEFDFHESVSHAYTWPLPIACILIWCAIDVKYVHLMIPFIIEFCVAKDLKAKYDK